MAMTNAEKQAAHRAKQAATLDSLTAAVVDLTRQNTALHSQLTTATARIHALELKAAKLSKGTK